jgi:3-dehydroquinate synthase
VALGGGVIGDMAGFAAATVLRGIPVVQVPTTLLAQVDAAIGGKTGIDHARGKNLIGAFHQPRLVLADVDTLATLSRRELVAGLAEVVKYGTIGDPALFDEIERRLPELLALNRPVLVSVVAACARQKAQVVSADEREETGLRAVLNFGHTVGHAVETVTGYRQYLHGEAVAIGMIAAARISQQRGYCDKAVADRLEALLRSIGLPVALPAGVAHRELGRVMASDKKSTGGRIRFIALEAIGRTRAVELAPADIVGHLG